MLFSYYLDLCCLKVCNCLSGSHCTVTIVFCQPIQDKEIVAEDEQTFLFKQQVSGILSIIIIVLLFHVRICAALLDSTSYTVEMQMFHNDNFVSEKFCDREIVRKNYHFVQVLDKFVY